MDDYCVLDTETTGLSSYYDEIIEVGVLRVRNNEIVEKYSQLIKPKYEVDDFITSLTGITKRENTFFDVQCSCTICTFRLRKNSISSHTKNLLCEQNFVISLHYMN